MRSRVEPEHGLFIAEGSLVIRRALAAGYPLRSALVSPRWLPALQADLGGATGPVYVGSDELLAAITGFHVHRGALAAMQRRPLPDVADVVAGTDRVVVIEDMVSHTNLGAVFRSAAALGVGAVLVTPSSADPLYRRSVRVSMGGVFAVPWTRLPAWPAGLDLLRAAGFAVWALTPDAEAVDLRSVTPLQAGQRVAMLLGTEGDGLSAAALGGADRWVRIAMAAGVDSLNVAAAAAVAFYALGGAD